MVSILGRIIPCIISISILPLMIKITGLFIVFLLCLHAPLPAQEDSAIARLLRQEKLAGAVWTLVQEDSITTYSSGMNNMDSPAAMLPTDKVHVGSITKTLLALGVLQLATVQKLNIDAPLHQYLPELPIQNPWHPTNPVTVRHLLDHTAGLSDLRFWHFFSTSARPNTPLAEFYTRNPAVLTIYEKPGQQFSYSNMGYTLLGMLIEKISGQPYEQHLDRHLLPAIGLHQSTFQFTSQAGPHALHNLAMGHFDNGSAVPALAIYLRPAGQFTTTARDMGELIRFILHKGKVGRQTIIDSAYFEAIGKPHYTVAFKNGLPNGYALGAALRDRHGVIGIAHSGNIIGYRAMLYVFPGEKKGFFISHNMDSETANYEAFNQELIERLQIPVTRTAIEEQTTRGMEQWEGYYVPHISKIAPLRLLDIAGAFTRITLNTHGITLTPFQKNELRLLHLGNGLFQASDKIKPSHYLYEQGAERFITSGISTLRQISGWKIWLTVSSILLGLGGWMIILFAGMIQTFRYKKRMLKRPIIWAFFGICLLTLSLVLTASAGMIQLGDKHPGTVLLYTSSILLPVLLAVTLLVYLKSRQTVWHSAGFWASCMVLQMVLLLLLNGLIPLATWQ